MADSFQGEVPKARINLKLDLHTGGATKKTELPLKLLVAGDFSHGQETAPLSERNKINVNRNNFNSVLSEYSPKVNLTVKNTLAGDGSEENISLTFQDMNDFTPEQVARQIPQLKAMLAMRNLLRDLKANLLDSADLQRWQAIPMNHYAPKAQALHALQQDALLLERWQRQGEPYRFGLGLYPGNRLWLAVQQAIDTYVPPPPLPKPKLKPVPKIVRLDSMSLFDSGKAVLKADSTRMLVNSLVDIRAKPGWLIVVAGHSDNTGSPQLNQTLSLKRAEAVRDWMRDTGDVPESCFAVQGYGDSRPVATNDTPEGRALNRRVEISLVPQADACQIPGNPSASSQDDDVSQPNGE